MMLFFAAILAVSCIHSGQPAASARQQTQAAGDEARLAEALSGKTAGPPQDCVSERDLGGHQFYGRSAILFTASASAVLYVNRPGAGCPDLGPGRALRLRITGARLCRGDVVAVIDPVTGVELGACSLGRFTPYR